MIITAIITMLLAVLTWVLSAIPSMKVDFQTEGMQSFWDIVNGVSCVLPVGTMFTIISLVLIIYAAEFLWYVFNWVISKVPFIN